MELILASGSPRRKEILENMGYSFTVKTFGCSEELPSETKPEDAAGILAKRKALAAFSKLRESGKTGFTVMGSDTVVALDGEILGKPKNKTDALCMLLKLSGKTHSVYTGVCVKNENFEEVFVNETKVEFYPLTQEMCRRYVETGEPMDKAGAYGIQSLGSVLVKKINGDFFSVMGLPAAQTARVLKNAGIFSEKGII